MMGINWLDAAGVHQPNGSATCFFIGSILGEFQVGLKIGMDLGRQRRESDNICDFASLPALDDLSVEMARGDALDAAGLTIDRIGDQDLPAHGKRFDTAGTFTPLPTTAYLLRLLDAMLPTTTSVSLMPMPISR